MCTLALVPPAELSFHERLSGVSFLSPTPWMQGTEQWGVLPTAYRASAGCGPHLWPRRSPRAHLPAHPLCSSWNLWCHPARSPLRYSHLVPLFSPSPQSSFQPLHWVRTEMSPNRSPPLSGSAGSSSNTLWMGGKEDKTWILVVKRSLSHH